MQSAVATERSTSAAGPLPNPPPEYRERGQEAAPVAIVARALGVVVITPPWNFPYAIPAGGVLAALMAGNTVILKPAPQTVVTAWLLVNHLWEAGIPRDVLQFFPIADGDIGRALITDPRVAAVVLTGSYETAQMFLSWRPGLRLFAETSGKNGIVITGQADRDLAIKDLVKSAFGHSGQKCSAASLAILEDEVYDDPAFRRQLRDAAASLHVGPSTDPASFITPLVDRPGSSLLRALTTLEPEEEWLLEPKQVGSDPCLWSPGIKLGVRCGSWFHQTECFGPVLGLMRAGSLNEAISIQNGTPFGLTAGIHSLDPAEIDQWQQRIEAGNLYINRPITGAIVQRQPFGGWKKSSIGPGFKAGGPNYVHLFTQMNNAGEVDIDRFSADCRRWWQENVDAGHDPSQLRSESNEQRYADASTSGEVIFRIPRGGDNAQARMVACLQEHFFPGDILVSDESNESDGDLAKRLPELSDCFAVLRTVSPPSDELLRAAHAVGMRWIDGPILADPRLELPRWFREQAISRTLHRYGQIADSQS